MSRDKNSTPLLIMVVFIYICTKNVSIWHRCPHIMLHIIISSLYLTIVFMIRAKFILVMGWQ